MGGGLTNRNEERHSRLIMYSGGLFSWTSDILSGRIWLRGDGAYEGSMVNHSRGKVHSTENAGREGRRLQSINVSCGE